MDIKQIYSEFEAYQEMLVQQNKLVDDVDAQLDELNQLLNTQSSFEKDFAKFKNGRKDYQIIASMKNDLETNAYIHQLEKTLELVSN